MKKFFLWTITLAGVLILSWICGLFIESREAVHWPQTKGQMISSLLTINHLPKLIDSSDDPMRWYGSDVQYEYSVSDRTYLSHGVAIYDGGVRSPQDALKVMNKYRHQYKVIVYYNPTNPQQAVLEPANIGDILIPLMWGALLTVMGLIFLYEQSIESKTHGTDNHLRWGNMYQKQGKLDQALKEFDKIIEISPYLVLGYKSRGNFNLQREKWDEAIADLNQALKIDPTDASIYFNLANAYLGKKQYHRAWEGMQNAMELGFKVKPEILEEIKKGL